ncbi:hypothetical protein NN561_012409 [Cricetulus griseus]
MQSGRLAKSGKAEPEKARARERSCRCCCCCGFLQTSGLRVPPAAVPLWLGTSRSKQVPQPLRSPDRRPCPRLPLPQPSALPGGPAYLQLGCLPGREGTLQGQRLGRSCRAPSLLARTQPPPPAAGFQSPRLAARETTRPQGAWAKPAQPRRAAVPHRAAPISSGPRARARPPAAPAPDSGAAALAAATTLGSLRGDPALKPPWALGEPWRTRTRQQAGLG